MTLRNIAVYHRSV